MNEFVRTLQEVLRELGIGIMRVEQADLEKGSFIITISEDLDCSGLPELDYEVCVYDEGFISGLMESFTGKNSRSRKLIAGAPATEPAASPLRWRKRSAEPRSRFDLRPAWRYPEGQDPARLARRTRRRA